MIARALVLAALAGCSSILGIEDLDGPGNSTPDGGSRDALPDMMIGDRVDLTGTATMFDTQAQAMTLAGAQLDFFAKGAVQQTTQTAADGTYAFSIATMMQPIDGLIIVHQDAVGTYPHTHNVPPILTGDRSYSVTTFSASFIQMMSQLAGEPHDPSATFVFFQVTTSDGAGVAGITIACETAKRVIYGDASGIPRQGEVQTSSSGLAYLFNAPPFLGTCIANTPGGVVAQRTIDGVNAPQSPGMIAISFEVSGD